MRAEKARCRVAARRYVPGRPHVLAVLAAAVAFVGVGRAHGADVRVMNVRSSRDLPTHAKREAVLAEQAAGARASARWRLRALYRLVVAGDGATSSTHARTIDAAARGLARDLDEARALGDEREHARAERLALAALPRPGAPASAAGQDPSALRYPSVPSALTSSPAASPVLAFPVSGAVLTKFGVGPDRATGLLMSRAGVGLAASAGQVVRAPAAGTVVRTAIEPGGMAVQLDHGAGWTTVVGGLQGAVVAAGEQVVAGQRLGAAVGGPGRVAGIVTFEVWRGPRAVDPSLLARGPAHATLARHGRPVPAPAVD